MKEKKKLDDLTKAKLIYSIELGVFSIVFLVLGILKLTNIYNLSKNTTWYVYVFLVITLLGGIWFAVDFVWTLKSEKRRKKQALIDKIILLPSSLATFIFDIYAFSTGVMHVKEQLPTGNTILNYYTGGLFLYFAIIYIFQAIYHFKYPVPLLLEEIESDKEEKNKTDNIESEKNN